ncbi:uncharacterized protein BDZ83DRAFT_658180 [Colletotrichum acutatum]|uniref:F-box domain-containing protein n=1 Tax=Glomerella acutata TaxID=27357 RepID=A0AAD8X920_GLOAC|nr:uncharacterized protein BDZ83DRAFT_658180 [Colletotrichum acutatum]KAK1705020.1 hypothetical protein BDZ83DRAFT_658180 [Colletotrichum acutatum]
MVPTLLAQNFNTSLHSIPTCIKIFFADLLLPQTNDMNHEPQTAKAMPISRLPNLPPEVLLEICRHLAAPMQDAFSEHLYWYYFSIYSSGVIQRPKLAEVLTCSAPLARLMRTCRAMRSMAGHELYSCYCDMLRAAVFPDLCLLLDIQVPERFFRHHPLPGKSLKEMEKDVATTLKVWISRTAPLPVHDTFSFRIPWDLRLEHLRHLYVLFCGPLSATLVDLRLNPEDLGSLTATRVEGHLSELTRRSLPDLCRKLEAGWFKDLNEIEILYGHR